MTQNEKDILLKDLCARLPYGVEVEYNSIKCEVLSIDTDNEELTIRVCPGYCPVVKFENVKLFLFPLSSMTEEQKTEEYKLMHSNSYTSTVELPDFYNKNHIDYRGLIPMDLAIDATGLNIY